MLAGKTVPVDLDLLPACQPAAHTLPRFEKERLQSTLGQVQRGTQPGNSPAYYNDVTGFLHRKDYIPQTARIS